MLPSDSKRLLLTVTLSGLCFGQAKEAGRCADPKDVASKLFGRMDAGNGALRPDLTTAARHCAGSGYTLLAEEMYNRGSLGEASRHITNAIRLLEAEPANARLLLGALRIQGTMHLERGMSSQAAAVIERLKAMPAGLPEQAAIIHGLAGALSHAAGDARSAEREYRLSIAEWVRVRRDYESVAERSNLGVLYISASRYRDAIAVLERANELLAEPGRDSSYHRVVVTNNLAVAYSGAGDEEAALRYARAAVRLAGSARAGRSALEWNVYSNCAAILRGAGHKKEASDVEYRAGRAAALANAVVDLSELEGTKHPQ